MDKQLFSPDSPLVQDADFGQFLQVARSGLAFGHSGLDNVLDPTVGQLKYQTDQLVFLLEACLKLGTLILSAENQGADYLPKVGSASACNADPMTRRSLTTSIGGCGSGMACNEKWMAPQRLNLVGYAQ